METRANYVLIGSFTLMISVCLLLFALWAAKYSASREWREFEVIFHEPVTGLSEGSSVLYNGLGVGTVSALALAPDDPRAVIARLRLQASAPIRADTRARISLPSLTGAPIIQLTGGHPDAPPLTSGDGQIPVILTEASALQNIADTANLLVERLDRVLSEDNITRINGTLANLEQLTSVLAARDADIDALVRNALTASQQLAATLSTTQRAMDGLDQHLVQRLPDLIERLDHTLSGLDSAASSLDGILSDNRASVQQFTGESLPQLGPALAELRALAEDLRQIGERFDAHPLRYLLGRDAPKEFDPE